MTFNTKMKYELKPKKKVYIAHPLTSYGDPRENFKKVTEICREIKRTQPSIVPVSPIHAFSYHTWEGDQTAVINDCLYLLQSCDEIWFYGEWWNSTGCLEELIFAVYNEIIIHSKGNLENDIKINKEALN